MSSVVFVSHTAALGGAELSLTRFLRATTNESLGLVVLTPASIDKWAVPDHVTVRQTKRTATIRHTLSIARELRAILAELDPTVVVVNSYSAAQYVAVLPKRGRRNVFFLRQEALPLELTFLRKLFSRYFTLRRFDVFLANSQWTASTLPSAISRHAQTILMRPVSGVVATHVKSPTHLASRPLRLLSLSRLSPWKGIHVAIEALRLLKARGYEDVELTIAGGDLFGEPGYASSLRDSTSGLNVKFLGHQSDVSPLLTTHDVLLCLSKDPEPFGQVVIQGLAYGLVVIATDQGGPAETIHNGQDGILVSPESPVEVAEAIRTLIDDPELVTSISAQANLAARPYLDGETTAALDKYLTDSVKTAE
ncbi:glycosyltransferase family 4 protein [Herbiconiux sp. P16]|uniref:glycosyltransferase family 4 protein n=1 Tax=Herbiconiux wuyangfengii TaxID=3342794 RepID=UPI0035B90500